MSQISLNFYQQEVNEFCDEMSRCTDRCIAELLLTQSPQYVELLEPLTQIEALYCRLGNAGQHLLEKGIKYEELGTEWGVDFNRVRRKLERVSGGFRDLLVRFHRKMRERYAS